MDERERTDNYRILPLPARRESQRSTPGHDVYGQGSLSGRLDIAACVVGEAAYFGSGRFTDVDEKHVRGFASYRGAPSAPGASLKGAIRSLFEALTGSCAGTGRDTDCSFEGLGGPLCPACRLFGILGYRGRLGFSEGFDSLDAPGEGLAWGLVGAPPGYAPNERKEPKGRRIYGQRVGPRRPGPKAVAVTAGERIAVSLSFEQASREELGFVFLAMGLDGTFFPKVGGLKFTGLGAVRFEPLRLALADRTRYGPEPAAAPDAGAFVKDCLAAALPKLGSEGQAALEAMRQVLSGGGT